ncbi:MAG: hypothetical protein AAF604_17850 [Acidobacteriota bacterium]
MKINQWLFCILLILVASATYGYPAVEPADDSLGWLEGQTDVATDSNQELKPGDSPEILDELGYCRGIGVCSLTPGCIQLPTSLRPQGARLAAGLSGWWSNPLKTKCGTKSCFLVLRCPCGKRLMTEICDGC